MFLRIALASASVIALSVGASAADSSAPGSGGYKDAYNPSWTGFYLGVYAGGADVRDHIRDVDNLNGGALFGIHQDPFVGGGQIGYNFQSGNIVYGAEADIGYVNFSNKRVFDPNFVGGTFTGVEPGAYGDLTARLGYTWNPSTLLYVKGGFAWFDGDAFIDNHLGGFGGTRGVTSTFTGWVIGGGGEVMFSPAWSVKLEYLHFDFGTEDATLTNTNVRRNFRYSNDLTADQVTVGLNYHFGSGYVPLK
jgi:outer membrane immunogenic protein